MKHLLQNPFEWKDLGAIAVGAVPMAFPVAVTEEVWDLSAEISLGRTLYLMAGCLLVIGIFIYYLYYHRQFDGNRLDFLQRVAAVYITTLVVSALLLLGVDRLPLLDDPVLALKRCVLVSVPASFTATIVDSLH